MEARYEIIFENDAANQMEIRLGNGAVRFEPVMNTICRLLVPPSPRWITIGRLHDSRLSRHAEFAASFFLPGEA